MRLDDVFALVFRRLEPGQDDNSIYDAAEVNQLNRHYKGYPDPSLVISVEEAAKLTQRRGVIFVDTRNYWKYAGGHIPGAHNLELYAFHWMDTSRYGMRIFIRQMAKLFSSIGIDDAHRVIFYEEDSGYDAARGVWLLNFLGHTNTQLLDGGLGKWKTEGLPVSTLDPKVSSIGKFAARPDTSLVATMDSLRTTLTRKSYPKARIIDTRNPGEYGGLYRRARFAGHLPGSVNIEWKNALRDDGTLKPARELRKLYSGFSSEEELVTYCQSGYRAAHSWLVLRLLGFKNVRNYLGSWYEWGNHSDTQIEGKPLDQPGFPIKARP